MHWIAQSELMAGLAFAVMRSGARGESAIRHFVFDRPIRLVDAGCGLKAARMGFL
jgi:hypothetical protein